jgi:ribosomal protein S18 acetylase RimI-like enzyme
MASRLAPCPIIYDLFVVESHRRRGIASGLLAAAEEQATRRGHTRLALAVAIDNAGARALYRRHGYEDAGLGEHVIEWYDADGERHVETCVYLIKHLSGA